MEDRQGGPVQLSRLGQETGQSRFDKQCASVPAKVGHITGQSRADSFLGRFQTRTEDRAERGIAAECWNNFFSDHSEPRSVDDAQDDLLKTDNAIGQSQADDLAVGIAGKCLKTQRSTSRV